MNKLKTFIVISAGLFMAACGPKPNSQGEYVIKAGSTPYDVRIKFFNDGRIESVQQYKDGKPDGYFANFNKNGSLKNSGMMNAGEKEGLGIICYPDGTLKSAGEYHNDEENGNFWLFKDKTLFEKREYLTIDGKNRMNQWIRFDDQLKPVFAESNFLGLKAAKDTIRKGESYDLTISLEASFNKQYMAVIMGPFDQNYQLPADSKCDTLIARNFITNYKTMDYKLGQNTVRGIVQDITAEKDKSDSKVRYIYFSKEFFVRK